MQEIIRLEMDFQFQQEKDFIQFINKTEKIALKNDIEQRKTTQVATFISFGLLALLLLTSFLFLHSKTKSHRLLTEKSQELEEKNYEISQQAEEIKKLNQLLAKDLDKKTKIY